MNSRKISRAEEPPSKTRLKLGPEKHSWLLKFAFLFPVSGFAASMGPSQHMSVIRDLKVACYSLLMTRRQDGELGIKKAL